MDLSHIVNQIKTKKSYLCVGLDSSIDKIPKHLFDYEDPIFEFNKKIIDATAPFCVAYKPNIAFYEAMGAKGWKTLEKTLDYIPKDIFTIADAKRGDIGNTSELYAKAFFDTLDFDAITVAPYMGSDSVKPFLNFNGKWVILLALTSNKSSEDFQLTILDKEKVRLYEKVLLESMKWADEKQMMYVVGATQTESITQIRELVPNHFLLIPGVGAQGGSLEKVSELGMNNNCGLLVNSSRGIIYADDSVSFDDAAGNEAMHIQQQMSKYLDRYLN